MQSITESTPAAPINPYGMSKYVVERMLRDFDAAYGIKSIALRHFNVAGCDPDGEIGEQHDPETHVIPLVIEAAAKGTVFSIFGTDYDTADGTCVRDYVHVSDLADAHVKALKELERERASQALNLGLGQGFSIRQIIVAVEQVTGPPVRVQAAARRLGDPATLVSDAARAREVLKWNPRYTQLTDIILTAWSWYRILNAVAAPLDKPEATGKRGSS